MRCYNKKNYLINFSEYKIPATFRAFAEPYTQVKEQQEMKYKLSDIIVGLLLVGLIIGTGFFQTQLKNQSQFFLLLLGLLTLGSLFAKRPFQTSILFYILLGIIFYINIFSLSNHIIDIINPNDGWVIDSSGEKQRVMQMNWKWANLLGLVLTPLLMVLYHKIIGKNKVLEISLTTIFIILTFIIYIKYEIH